MTKQILTDVSLVRQVAANSFHITVNKQLSRDVVVITFPKLVSTIEVIDKFTELALTGIETQSLVAFGEQNPQVQLPIVSPGGRVVKKETSQVFFPLLYPVKDELPKIYLCPVTYTTGWKNCGFIATTMD